MEVDQAAPQVHAVDLAQGMLMERFQVSSPVASDMLRAHARACRLPVAEVARWLVATRYLL
jgi:AmiR/NasT family two-component response regulator